MVRIRRSDKTFSVGSPTAILMATSCAQHLHVVCAGILDALIRVVDRGCFLLQCAPEGRQHQLLVDVAPQMPTLDATGEDIQDHSQIDELLPKDDVGDVYDPYLVWMVDNQLLHQVGATRVGVVAVGRPALVADHLPGYAHRLHQLATPLAVHL